MANYEYIDATGVVVPDTSTILSDVTAEYTAAFGTDLVTTPDSPAGLLINAETVARTEVVQNNAALANQINPSIAAGVFLDAIGNLLGIQREVATQTYVTAVTVTGVAGTVIPAGSLAATAAGDQFATVTNVTIGAGGSSTVDFESVAYGAIPCSISALNTVVSSVLGWETVNNTTAGALGAATQSDVGFRAYRTNTLGFQGVGLAPSTISALYNVAGVTSVWYQENTAATTQTINSISMVAHSIYAVVNGGSQTDIAAALLENKSSGCAWNGGTSVSVIEPASGQAYTVLFDYSTPVEVSIELTTTNGNAADIQNAIISYMNGTVPNFPLGTGTAWGIGGTLSCFEIAAAVAAQFPTYIITNVEIKLTSGGSFATTPLSAAVNENFYTTTGNITVTVSG